jgi:peptide/nickel transport system substrate-binding protein
LFRFKEDGSLEPNVAKSFTVNDNATEYIIYLREGMKWSDGHPFTADDCIFFYEHMVKPRTFGQSIYRCYYSSNSQTREQVLCRMEKVNDYAFKVLFDYPNPNFLEYVAIDAKWFFAPTHYMKEYLPEFIGEAAAAAKAKELGYSDVRAMGEATGYLFWPIPGRPTLRPWVAANNIDSDLFIMERNPYYWKTDSEGRQLPYIDQLHWVRIGDMNQAVLKVMSGETDMRIDLPFTNFTALKQNEKNGKYRLLMYPTGGWADVSTAIQLNQSIPDPKYRALFQNKDFRKALSIAVDRKEMAALVSNDIAVPFQTSPPEGGLGYSKAWSEKWTEYNPQEAKRLLEQSCRLKMGRDGYYTFEDGTPLIIEMVSNYNTAPTMQAAELFTEKYFKNIGLRFTFSVRDRSLFEELSSGNKLIAILNPLAPMSTIHIALRPDTAVPVRNYAVWYGAYGEWVSSNGAGGVEPSGDILKLINLYKQMLGATNKKQIDEIALQMLKLHEENIWQIGYLGPTPMLMSVKEDLRNVPEKLIYADEYRGVGLAHLQNWYFASDRK